MTHSERVRQAAEEISTGITLDGYDWRRLHEKATKAILKHFPADPQVEELAALLERLSLSFEPPSSRLIKWSISYSPGFQLLMPYSANTSRLVLSVTWRAAWV